MRERSMLLPLLLLLLRDSLFRTRPELEREPSPAAIANERGDEEEDNDDDTPNVTILIDIVNRNIAISSIKMTLQETPSLWPLLRPNLIDCFFILCSIPWQYESRPILIGSLLLALVHI